MARSSRLQDKRIDDFEICDFWEFLTLYKTRVRIERLKLLQYLEQYGQFSTLIPMGTRNSWACRGWPIRWPPGQ